MIHLFLDDERRPEHVTWTKLPDIGNHVWQIVRSYEQFTQFVSECQKNKTPITAVSFDHDLGFLHYGGDYSDEKTGMHCARYLAQVILDEGWDIPVYTIHSMNPIGWNKIEAEMEDLRRQMKAQSP